VSFIGIGRLQDSVPNYLYVCKLNRGCTDSRLRCGPAVCSLVWYMDREDPDAFVRRALMRTDPASKMPYNEVLSSLNRWFDDNCESNPQPNINIIKTTCEDRDQTVIFRSSGIDYPVPNYLEVCPKPLRGRGCTYAYYSRGSDPRVFVGNALRN